MGRRGRLLGLGVAVWVVATGGVAAQVVRQVRWTFEGPRTTYDFNRLLAVRPGEVLTDEALAASLQNVYLTGLCEQVSAQVSPVEGLAQESGGAGAGPSAVDLTMTCVAPARIGDVRFFYVTSRTFSPRRLRQHMTDFALDLPYDRAQVERWKEAIRRFYEEAGFESPTVDIYFDEIDVQRRTGVLRVYVDEGTPRRVRRWTWSTGPVCMALRGPVEAVLRKAERWNPALQSAVQRVVQRVRQEGYWTAYLEATWSDGVVHLDGQCGPRVRVEVVGWPPGVPRVQEWLDWVGSARAWSDDLLEVLRAMLQRTLQAHAYPQAQVTGSVQVQTPTTVAVVFRVEPGPMARITSIQWEGLPAELHSEVQLWRPGSPWVYDQFQTWLRRFQVSLQERGYQPVEFQVIPEYGNPGNARLRILCDIGPRRYVQDVDFWGNSVWSDEELAAYIPLRRGQALERRLLDLSLQVLRQKYYQAGYFRVQVEPHVESVPGQPDTVRVDFYILEGEPTYVDRVIFRGLYHTQAGVLYRLLPFREGAPLQADQLEAFQNRLYDLGLFERVEIPLPLPQQMGDRENLLVILREARPTRFSYGLGYQENDGIRGILNAQYNNFLGRGYRLYALFRFSFVNWRVLGSFGGRSMGDLPVEWQVAGETGFQRQPNFDLFQSRGLLQGVHRYGPRSLLTGQWEVSETRLENLAPTLSPEEIELIAREFENLRLTKLSLGWLRDTRDSVLNATQGQFLSVTGEFSLRSWGSDVTFLKLAGQWNVYLPLTSGWVLAIAQRAGWGRRFEAPARLPPDQRVLLPPSQRFFAGGSRTHRGFAFNTLGPPLGGNALWLMTVEQRFNPRPSWGLVLFLDVGNVFLENPSLRWSDFRKAGGFGLRYIAPFGPVGVDLAWLLDRRPGERRFHWFVTIGQEF
ncbi:MAG: BamA/TamA family outer membrane protein [Acidobacteria bacterium]|nr:BamA/TamA family outer membrane protein [Acidobacteriota bacterium]MDW7983065.1 BamA/TamA family outer membrane protein [Acidobacteriota bacterium]